MKTLNHLHEGLSVSTNGAYGELLAQKVADKLSRAAGDDGSSRRRRSKLVLVENLALDSLQSEIEHCHEQYQTIHAVALFDSSILISPDLSGSGVCVDCFIKRLTSSPPQSYTTSTINALVKFSEENPTVSLATLYAYHIEIVAHELFLRINRSDRARESKIIDTVFLAPTTSIVMPVHGCPVCYGYRSGESRFTNFMNDLKIWKGYGTVSIDGRQ